MRAESVFLVFVGDNRIDSVTQSPLGEIPSHPLVSDERLPRSIALEVRCSEEMFWDAQCLHA